MKERILRVTLQERRSDSKRVIGEGENAQDKERKAEHVSETDI